MESKVYSKKQLYGEKKSRRFAGNAREAAFLLGGIGTGNISVGARGELRDFEFYNRPGKECLHPMPFSLFGPEKKERLRWQRCWSPELIRPIPVPMDFRLNALPDCPGWMSLKCWESIQYLISISRMQNFPLKYPWAFTPLFPESG